MIRERSGACPSLDWLKGVTKTGLANLNHRLGKAEAGYERLRGAATAGLEPTGPTIFPRAFAQRSSFLGTISGDRHAQRVSPEVTWRLDLFPADALRGCMPLDDEGLVPAVGSMARTLQSETVGPVGIENDRLCVRCAAALTSTPRLMDRSNADRYLALSTDQLEWLIRTRQITPIRIRGEERFDRRDLDLLIESYKGTAKRRMGKC